MTICVATIFRGNLGDGHVFFSQGHYMAPIGAFFCTSVSPLTAIFVFELYFTVTKDSGNG